MELSFLIPTYNDAGTIKQVIKEASEIGEKIAKRYEIVVVNDGSTDSTPKILKKYKNLNVLTHGKNQGYGKTIKELYYRGRNAWLFTIPGDYQVGAKELTKLLLYKDRASMIIGWRKNRHDPIGRIVQSVIYNLLLRLLFGLALHDVNSVRLIRRDMIHKIKLLSTSAFVDAEVAIKAKEAGFRILEVPIVHKSSKKRGSGGKWWTILPTIWEMIRHWLRK